MPQIFKDQQGSYWTGLEEDRERERGYSVSDMYTGNGNWANHAGFSRHIEDFGFYYECGGAIGGL